MSGLFFDNNDNDEPYIVWDDQNGQHKITQTEAINRQKDNALKHNFRYKTDQEALDDFIAVHWAWKKW